MPYARTAKNPSRTLSADDVARQVERLQDLVMPATAEAMAAGDLLRINDAVKAVADAKLDFFDVPAHFVRVMKGQAS